MNAYDVMDAMNGIAPEKVQHALELMGYIPGEKKKHSARKTLRIVLMNLHHLAAIPTPGLGGFIDDM